MPNPEKGKAGPRRVVACPSCGEPALFAPANPWRPFCSERCRLTDLGAWASESYRIPTRPAEDAPDEGTDDAREGPNTTN